MTRIRRCWWLGVLCGMAVVGCGGSSSSSANPENAKAFCSRLGDVQSQIYSHCSNSTLPPYMSFDLLLDCEGFAEAQEAGRIAYQAGGAGACLDALQGMTCSDAYQVFSKGLFPDFASLPASCQGVIEPKVAEDGACFSLLGYECDGGYCNIDSQEACMLGGATCKAFVAADGDCSSGRCAPGYTCSSDVCVARAAPTILGEGGDCSVSNVLCRDGLRCSSGSCVARTAADGSCSSGEECLEGLRCIADTCKAPFPVDHACTGGDCAEGLYCNDSELCAAQPRLGETCAEASSGDYVVCVDSFCDDTVTPTPVCAAYVDPGQACFLHDDEFRYFSMCGPGYLCYPVSSDSYEWGVCGRNHCPIN